MPRDLIVLGSAGLAREVAQIVDQVNALTHQWNFLGFIAASAAETGKDLGFGRVLGDDAWLLNSGICADLVIGIGRPHLKPTAVRHYLDTCDRFDFPTIIHPTASIDRRHVLLGRGNVIAAGCRFTCDIRVGDFNLFNLNTTVGHDVTLGDFNVCNPSVNISGRVTCGDRVLLGTGCHILECVTIGDDAVLGAGCVAVTSVTAASVVVGVPAKPLRKTLPSA